MRLGGGRKMKLSFNSMPEPKKSPGGAQPAAWKSGGGEARQQLAEPQAEERRRLPTAACHEALNRGCSPTPISTR